MYKLHYQEFIIQYQELLSCVTGSSEFGTSCATRTFKLGTTCVTKSSELGTCCVARSSEFGTCCVTRSSEFGTSCDTGSSEFVALPGVSPGVQNSDDSVAKPRAQIEE